MFKELFLREKNKQTNIEDDTFYRYRNVYNEFNFLEEEEEQEQEQVRYNYHIPSLWTLKKKIMDHHEKKYVWIL